MDSEKESQQVASGSSSNPVASESPPLKSVLFLSLSLLLQLYLSILSCKTNWSPIFFFSRKVRSSFAFDFFSQLEEKKRKV